MKITGFMFSQPLPVLRGPDEACLIGPFGGGGRVEAVLPDSHADICMR
jgi:hypothetical protein